MGRSELCGSRLMPWAEELLPYFVFSIREDIASLVVDSRGWA